MTRRQRNVGCIDPHGMWPFPKDRESCLKCHAIRARFQPRPWWKRGLPYGWWKDPDVMVPLLMALWVAAVGLMLWQGWFL